MSLRLITAARKSRSGNASEDERYTRQDDRAGATAERDGHVIVSKVHDTVSSQTAPWQRKNLRSWMTEAGKLSMYDGVLVSDTDRLSRTDDRGWHDIEAWCYATGKVILTAEGVQFPPRDDSDRYQWLGLKRRARTYWEDVKSKHADGARIVRENGAATGRPPFGYRVVGATYNKRFEVDPVTGPVALELFKRMARGDVATSVALWLGSLLTVVPFASVNVRTKRVLDTVRNDAYFGERNGHRFPMLAPDMPDLIATARAMANGRTFDHGGNRVTHMYSSAVYCECGATYTRHQSLSKAGKPVGSEKYRCSRGRRGYAGESRCEFPPYLYDDANAAVEAAVGAIGAPDLIVVATGGDAQRQARLDALAKQIDAAAKVRDYGTAGRLQAEYAEAEASSDPVVMRPVFTGKTIGQRFTDSDLDARRAMMTGGMFRVILTPDGVLIDHDDDGYEGPGTIAA